VLERLIGTEIRRVESPILASCGQKNGSKVDPLRPGQEWGLQGLPCTAHTLSSFCVARQNPGRRFDFDRGRHDWARCGRRKGPRGPALNLCIPERRRQMRSCPLMTRSRPQTRGTKCQESKNLGRIRGIPASTFFAKLPRASGVHRSWLCPMSSLRRR
jgi:hypothetical protein